MKAAPRIPFEFVLDLLVALAPRTRPMFGCTAVYIGPKIVFVLRDKPPAADSGVWVATTPEHHASLRQELPSLRSIGVLGPGVTGWQNLPASAADFESSVERACELVELGDARIGKIPKKKPASSKKRSKASKPSKPSKVRKAGKPSKVRKPSRRG